MRIPNKFNGYMSDGRRLYPDPATSAIIASSLASAAAPVAASTTAAGLAAASAAAAPTLATAAGTAAIPGIVGSAAPALSAAAPAATTAAQGLGAAQAMSPEIAANLAQSQAANQGIMSGAQAAAPAVDQTAALGVNEVGALNSAPPIDPFTQASPIASPTTPAANSTYQLGSKATPDFLANAPSPTNADLYGNAAQGIKPSYNVADGANVAKDVVNNASLKMPGMEPLTTSAAPPSKLMEGFNAATKFAKDHPYITAGGIMLADNMMKPSYNNNKKKYSRSGDSNFQYTEPSTGEYTPIFEPTAYAKQGGLMGYAVGGPVEQMSAQNAIGGNMMYPQSQLQTPMYSNPMTSRPMPNNVINSGIDAPTNAYSGEPRYAEGGKLSAFERMAKEEEIRKKKADAQAEADLEKGQSVAAKGIKPYSRTQSTNSPYAAAVKELQGLGKKYGIKMAAPAKTNTDLMGDQDQIEYAANGGIMHGLGGYSDGGRLLKGPGDGVSDSIPAVIGNKQPARLADGEFVIPARIVSELGNGSTEAGARKLYAMMERVQKRRGKTTGKGKVAVNSKADKHLPA
jgi:hypothetical protein